MGDTLEETLEPLREGAHDKQGDDEEALLVVLHHADLNRVGAVSALPTTGEAVVIGRGTPLFTQPGAVGPLHDPCLSRRLCAVRYDAGSRTFELTPDDQARVKARLHDATGVQLDGRRAPAGSVLALGDRALLGLVVRPSGQGDDLGLLGESAATETLRRRLRAVAAGDETVLITGETGVGKELVARAIHRQSPRAAGVLVAVNCASLTEGLAESELFGHVRGAFSGATDDRRGLFGAARGGTLFLDEIGELPLPVQAKLLRALELRRVRPVGSQHEIPVDVRIVAATHRDLEGACKQGAFREDLLARLSVLPVAVPPLRERRLDVPLLFARLLGERLSAEAPRAPGCAALRERLFRAASIDPPLLPQDFTLSLLHHDWPRNVRELVAMVAGVVASAREQGALVLPPLGSPPPPSAPPRSRPDRDELLRLLDKHDGVQSRVARALRVSTTTIDRWMREQGIARPRDLSAEVIEATLREHEGDARRAANSLGVSERGLKLRLRQFDQPPSPRKPS